MIRRHLLPWVLLVAAPGTALPLHAVALGWERLDLTAAGSYTLNYVPHSLNLSQPAPAIVFLHGQGATPEGWQSILAPLAEQLGFVLVVPRAAATAGGFFTFGVGADDAVITEALRREQERVVIDTRRIGIAGHSAGGAYALVLAYSTASPFNGVFSLSAPYRTVVRLADPTRVPPLRFYYGTLDPNYQNAYPVLSAMFDGLGVPQQAEIAPGKGHNDIGSQSLLDGFAFLLAQPVPPCAPGPTTLCLRGGRFRVEASWETTDGQGPAGVVRLTDESGYLWFFDPQNVEVTLKLIAACPFNQRWWVYAAGTTDVGVVLTVSDLVKGKQVSYVNPRGTAFQPVLDSGAFATCP
ncbi:MAG TPA: alpha/beta fold hydrolase [Thermoanaerobaculia bacterium]|nr:alpha/beta fold hydrolase [Thermoanaerobaculia bacterium]